MVFSNMKPPLKAKKTRSKASGNIWLSAGLKTEWPSEPEEKQLAPFVARATVLLCGANELS